VSEQVLAMVPEQALESESAYLTVPGSVPGSEQVSALVPEQALASESAYLTAPAPGSVPG
jgi:hypothetical protein